MERLSLIANCRRRLLRRRERLLLRTNSIRARDRDGKEVVAIEDALEKIREGVYGDCEDCGDSISSRQLSVYPLTKTCTACEETDEIVRRNPLFV